MVQGVSNARIQTSTIQQSDTATNVQKGTKTSTPTPSKTQSQVAEQKPVNKAVMKSEHKLGEQLKSAQLQGQLHGKVSSAPKNVQLPGVYEMATGQKTTAAQKGMELPGVYQIVTEPKPETTPKNVKLPGVYEIATGSGKGSQKTGAKRKVMDFSKGPAFEARRDLKLGHEGEDVAKLQEDLTHWRELNGSKTGDPVGFGSFAKFDKSTQDAVREFQKKSRLPQTGVVDKRTAALLKLESDRNFMSLPEKTQAAIRSWVRPLHSPKANELGKEGKKHCQDLYELGQSPVFSSLSPKVQNAVLGSEVGKIKDTVWPLVNNEHFSVLSEQMKLELLKAGHSPETSREMLKLLNNEIFRSVSPAAQKEMIDAAWRLGTTKIKLQLED